MSSDTLFGRYSIVGRLGEGGFATVYRAWDPLLDREVALKALPMRLAGDASLRARFMAEARALASLRHPNIIAFFDIGEEAGQPYFTMELIDGPTLARLISAGQGLPLGEVIAILGGLCSAIDYLHGAGLVHRDIKAANVMRDPGGRTVLMDFGIVRMLDQTQNTRTGSSLGTPETMAPEQVRGQHVGPAADIYALGVVTYQLLAGRPPFVGDTGYVMHAHAYEPPPPLRMLRPGLPEPVYNAIDSALAKTPENRPASAAQFLSALTGAVPLAVTAQPVPLIVAPPLPRRRRVPVAALSAVVVLLATAAVAVIAMVVTSGKHPSAVANDVAAQTAPAGTVAGATRSTVEAPEGASTPAVAAANTASAAIKPSQISSVAAAAPSTRAPLAASPSPASFVATAPPAVATIVPLLALGERRELHIPDTKPFPPCQGPDGKMEMTTLDITAIEVTAENQLTVYFTVQFHVLPGVTCKIEYPADLGSEATVLVMTRPSGNLLGLKSNDGDGFAAHKTDDVYGGDFAGDWVFDEVRFDSSALTLKQTVRTPDVPQFVLHEITLVKR